MNHGKSATKDSKLPKFQVSKPSSCLLPASSKSTIPRTSHLKHQVTDSGNLFNIYCLSIWLLLSVIVSVSIIETGCFKVCCNNSSKLYPCQTFRRHNNLLCKNTFCICATDKSIIFIFSFSFLMQLLVLGRMRD